MTDEEPIFIRGARFINPEVEVDEDLWSRNPNDYTPTTKFTQRFKEFGVLVEGDVIRDAIQYCPIYEADGGCVAFVNNLGGVAYYIIVANDDGDDYAAVSIWPYVYDREGALDTGQWSSKDLDKIEELSEEKIDETLREYGNEV